MIRRDAETILADGAKPKQELKVYSNADPKPSEGEIIQPKRGIWRTYDDRMGYFEAAEGGTLILDEIGDMPLDAQAHLLRVLEDRKIQRIGEHTSRDVNVRIIAMTNRDLKKEVDEGRFREDLYYRLNEFPIHLPTLRERLEDIPFLSEHFLQCYSDESGREMDGFAPGVFGLLQGYTWPGNVRELRSAIHSSADYAAHEGTRIIQIHHLPSQHLDSRRPQSQTGNSMGPGQARQVIFS